MKLFIIHLLTALIPIFSQNSKSTLQLILESHPEIQGYDFLLKSKFADSKHADVYPDPKIGVSFKNYPYYGSPLTWDANRQGTPTMTGTEYSISQEIPFPNLLGLQKNKKTWEAKEFIYVVEMQKNRFLGGLLSTLIQLDFIAKKKEYISSIDKLSSCMRRVAGSQYIAGKESLNSSGQNHINSIESKERIAELESLQSSLEASLEYYTISDKIRKEDIKNINYKDILPTVENIQKDIYNIPEIQRAKANLEISLQEEKLESLTHYPETEIYFAYMKRNVKSFVLDNGPIATAMGNWQIMDQTEFRGDLISMGITIRVPFWSIGKNKDLNQKNQWKVEAGKKEVEQKEKFFHTEILKLLAILKGIEKKMELMEKHHIPALNTNIKSQGANYQTGKMGFSEITKSQIDLLTLKYNLEDLKEKKYLLINTLSEITGRLTEL
jgi:hypothetical protein